MIFQISNEPHGYVVEVHYQDIDGIFRWHPLRNFGERQGDAKLFKGVDCPKLEDWQIRVLIKGYDPDIKYERISDRKFKKS